MRFSKPMVFALGSLAVAAALGTVSGQPNPNPTGPFAPRTKYADVLNKQGGNPQSNDAIEKGIAWIARHQEPEGRWNFDHKKFAERGPTDEVSATGLALLPFLGIGKSHRTFKNNPYDKPIEKGLKFLITIQNKKSGQFGKGTMAHALATTALIESYGLTRDGSLAKPSTRALDYLVNSQLPDGRWPGDNEFEAIAWPLIALQAAKAADLDIPADTTKRVRSLLDTLVDAKTGKPGEAISVSKVKARSFAAGTFGRQLFDGWTAKTSALQKAISGDFKPVPPTDDAVDATLAFFHVQILFHFGGDDWNNWNPAYRDRLIKTQDDDRPKPGTWGSWSPKSDASEAMGRLYVTALNLLTLETPCRYPQLP